MLLHLFHPKCTTKMADEHMQTLNELLSQLKKNSSNWIIQTPSRPPVNKLSRQAFNSKLAEVTGMDIMESEENEVSTATSGQS